MPRRLTPLVNGNFYHIYNHGIDHRQTFTNIPPEAAYHFKSKETCWQFITNQADHHRQLSYI